MELVLFRTYYPDGTNGDLYAPGDEKPCCHTIELPWKDNQNRISCIPEGRYPLSMRFTPKRQWHLLVRKVPNRTLILFHPANNAVLELEGCIAPVSALTGSGRGSDSRLAFNRLLKLVGNALEKEPVFLTLKTNTTCP